MTTLAAISVLAVLLRVAGIAHEALWGDEVFSRDAAVGTVEHMFALVRADVVHPPLYYVVLHAFTQVVGASPLDLRIPSLVAGSATVLAVGLMARRLFGRADAALLSAALLAVSQLHIYYSQEVRSYALYALLGVLLAGAVMLAAVQGRKLQPWIVVAGLAVATVMTHNAGVFLVVATAAVVLASPKAERKGLALRWFASVAPAAVCTLAWTAYVLPAMRAKGGLGQNLAWIEVPGVAAWAAMFGSFVGIPNFPHGTTVAFLGGGALAAIAVLSLTHLSSGTSKKSFSPTTEMALRRRVAVITFASCAFVPPLIVFAISRAGIGVSFWGERHVLPSACCFLVLVAVGACAIADRWRPVGIACAAAALAPGVAAVPDLIRYPLRVQYDEAAAVLSKPQNRAIAAYTTAEWNLGKPINRYVVRRDSVVTLPDGSDAALPDSIWLAYRPFQAEERRRRAEFASQGWTTRDSIAFATRPGASVGAVLVRLARQAPASARQP